MARTQSERQAELITPLGADVLLLHQMMAHEGVSQLFDYDLVVFSEDENIDLNDLIGQHAHVELELPHGDTRYFAGHVTRFSFLGFSGNLAKYKLTMHPWLWFLTLARNNRIFQNKTVPEIIKEVCAEHGFSDIDDRLTDSYEPREFCVQYRESDFEFLSRLMEDEGIYYYFVHEPGKHELVLADSISAHEPYGDYAVVPWFPPDQHDHRERDHLSHWELSRAVRSGKHSLRDYNFETPKANLEVKSQIIRGIEHAEYEAYDYPGGYTQFGEGETSVRKKMEALQADFEVLGGSGNARGLQPGFLFELEEYPREDQNREYLILTVTHDFFQDAYDSEGSRSGEGFNYSCSIQAMPSAEVFRPPRNTPRPIVYGPQTAVVVGESGQEIWTDRYGRVKVEFHWDRLDQKDENSSCWIRVSQNWAGKKWGAQFLPRIGHEVIVEFLEGDPDRPIITGSVYNADNMPPYDLPDKATQSGIKTRSSKNGTKDNFNEIRFEDKKGSEQFYMHAEKNMDVRVENDYSRIVDNDYSLDVGRDQTINIGRHRKIDVGGNETITISKDRTETVIGDESVVIKKGRRKTVTNNESVTYKSDFIQDIKSNWKVDVARNTNMVMLGSADIKVMTGINVTAPGGFKIFDSNLELVSGKVKQQSSFADNVDVTKYGFTGVSYSQTGLSTSVTSLGISYTSLAIGHTSLKMDIPGFEIKKVGGIKLESTSLTLGKTGLKIDKSAMKIEG